MKNHPLTESEIILLYERYVDMLYRICFTFFKNETDTEDAVQAIFVKMIEQAKRFDTHEHEKAWLIVMAQNYCKNKLKHWWHKVIPLDLERHQPICNSNSQSMLELVLNLPDQFKMPVYLYYYEGYSTDEVAQILNLNASTLRSRLKKARELLKLTIGDE